MEPLVPIFMFGWLFVAVCLFACLRPRRAATVGLLLAWLFLPQAGYHFPGLNYTRLSATAIGLLIGMSIFDFRALLSLRPKWVDLPIIIWCLCPLPSSITNGLGVYDGFFGVSERLVTWGAFYVIGRLHYADTAGLRELAVGIFVGGLIYTPLCLFEIRMSPLLYTLVYGRPLGALFQVVRYGGYRPVVFMQHGLMVGFWMTAASLAGLWLWATRTQRNVLGVPMAWAVITLSVTALLCKSIGAIALLGIGLVLLFATRWLNSRLVVTCAVAAIPAYMVVSLSGAIPREGLVKLIANVAGEERAQSFEARKIQEEVFSAHALERPVFGWGGWERWIPVDSMGMWKTRGFDSHLVIALSQHGFVGLVSMYLVLLLPVGLFVWKYPAATWSTPDLASASVLVMMLFLLAIDSLFNAMANPLLIVAAGALSGWGASGSDWAMVPSRSRHDKQALRATGCAELH